MADLRPAQILDALIRLGFRDFPAFGSAIDLRKMVLDHPEGGVTISASLDMDRSPCSSRDLKRIQRSTKLTGELWERALAGDLSRQDYDEHLRGIAKGDLVSSFWRFLFEKDGSAGAPPAPPAESG